MSKEASGSFEEILKDVRGLFDLRDAFAPALHLAGAPGDDGDDGGDGDDGSDDNSDDGDDSSTDDGGDDGSSSGQSKDIKDPEKKRLSDEAARFRTERNQLRQELKDLRDWKKEQESKDLSDNERLVTERDELKGRAESAESLVEKQAVQLGFFMSGAASMFVDSESALKLLDLSDVEIEDGVADADAIKAKAEELLKRKPFLAANDDGDSGDDDDSGNSTSGRSLNSRRKGDKSKNGYEELAKKFPALRR